MEYLISLSACRYVQIGVASFGSIVDCGSKPGGFSRLTYDVLQWIRKIKVYNNFICYAHSKTENTFK